MDKRVDLKVTFQCNNRCEFCAQGHKRELYVERTLEDAAAELLKAYEDGARGAVFTGGEPSMHPRILELVKAAKKTGFETIQLQTNGRTLAYPGFCAALREAGADEVAPSLHGAIAATHDALTRAPGSFKQSVAGIGNAVKAGFNVVTNTVITAQNYRELPGIAKILISLGVNQYQFAFIHIVGTAKENKKRIVPRKTAVMPFVKKALDLGIRAGVPCYTEAIPFCLMKGYEDCVAENMIPGSRVVDADMVIKDYAAYRRNEGKAKGPLCKSCLYFKACEGPWREYPAMYGWSEFKPVKAPKAAAKAVPEKAKRSA